MFSEFGRRLKENASSGTDHGTAAPVLLAGKPVKGGLVGPPPDLAHLDDSGDPRFTTDFRDVYATLAPPLAGRRPRADPGPPGRLAPSSSERMRKQRSRVSIPE